MILDFDLLEFQVECSTRLESASSLVQYSILEAILILVSTQQPIVGFCIILPETRINTYLITS